MHIGECNMFEGVSEWLIAYTSKTSAGLHNDPESDSSVHVRIHMYRMYLTDAFSPTSSLPTTLSALQDLGLPLPPRFLPRCSPTPNHTFPKPPVYPQVSTITPNAPFSLQPNNLAQALSDPITTPGATPPCTCVCTYIAYALLTLVALPTAHARRLLASQDPWLPLPPRRLPRCPHKSKHAFTRSYAYPEISSISFNILFSVQ